MAAEDSMSSEEPQKTSKIVIDKTKCDIFTVEVLQIMKDAQQQHGLRHGDFQRYRSYCSRRIRRIRKSLHFPQGDRRRVNPKKINMGVVMDERYIHLPLFCAERAWAYAMQLKSEANTEPRKKFHLMARLKKAVVYAEELYTLSEHEKCDARTKLECQAYRLFIKGSLEFECEQWKPAIESYTSAKAIYENLAKALPDEQQVVYLQRVAEVEPNIRYCAYNIGDESAIKDLMQMRREAGGGIMSGELDTLLSQTREKQASTLSEVTWLGRTVPVKIEDVRLFLLNLQESDKEVEEAEGIDNKMSIYESVLKQCIDAQQVLRDTLQDDQNFKLAQRGQPFEGKVSNQHFLHSYLAYIKLKKTIDRNLLLIESLKKSLPGGGRKVEGRKITKPQDLVRLYDIIIQNLLEIPNLPGIEDDSSLREEMDTRAMGFKAFKSFYIAHFYAGAKKWREAIGLYCKVLETAQEALKNYSRLGKNPVIQREIDKLKEIQKEADSLKHSCNASSILDTDSLTDQMADLTVSNNKPLLDRLDQYSEDAGLLTKKAKLVSFPPDFKPIPCRPLFFDLALNHVEMPSLEDKMEQKKAGGGLTGMVKGWFWGSK